jgi:signal transduction histidine kinase
LSTVLQHPLASLTENEPTCVRLAVEDCAAQAVSSEQSLYLLRVIQEAVSNCIRHGQELEVRVSLKRLKQGVRLNIRDNGRGLNPKAAKGTGHGLANMAASARKVRGWVTIFVQDKISGDILAKHPRAASSFSSHPTRMTIPS